MHQPCTNAVAQFLTGRFGEGDHQDFRRHQWPGKAVVALSGSIVWLAVTQHQAYVEQGDSEGLAGAGAGFNQLAAA